MENRTEAAVEYFNNGFNCSQSVLAAFCEKYGMDIKSALKIACGLGGGIRSGEVCGAVSGAVLVIGLKYGHCEAGDNTSKSNCYSKTDEFIAAFKLKNNSVVCREILGCDISEKQGYEEARSRNLFKTTCVEMVKSAVEILAELGY